jgi:hypothetical protein
MGGQQTGIPDSSFQANPSRTILPGNEATWALSSTNISYVKGLPVNTSVCSVQFYLPVDIGPPVFLYYRLTNFYQNHRRYVNSLDTDQLSGTAVLGNAMNQSSCNPIRTDENNRPYYPCGLIANSIFNDTFSSPSAVNPPSNSTSTVYNMTNIGIAWTSDKSRYGPTKYAIDQIAVPPNWQKRWGPDGYTTDNPPPDLTTDEAFQNWMRTAGLPDFSKLALRNDVDVMAGGRRWQVDINLSTAPVRPFP